MKDIFEIKSHVFHTLSNSSMITSLKDCVQYTQKKRKEISNSTMP